MEGWQHYNPVKIYSAPGVLDQLGTLAPFERPLLVTSPGFSRRGLTKRITKLVGAGLLVYDAVTPNPDLDEIDALVGELRSAKIDGVIALGGGSVLDTGKAVAASLAIQRGKFLAAMLRSEVEQLPERSLPVIAIPTTAGTGSEVTPFATIWDGLRKRKYSLMGEQLFPRIALLDPTLTLTLPQHETLYSALDCISHALETLWNRWRTPLSEGLALQALQIAVNALPSLLSRSDELSSRTAMQHASLLAGIAISQNRTALAHSISYPLTSYFNIPHGLAASFTLVALIDLMNEKIGWPESDYNSVIIDRTRDLLIGLHLYREIAKFASPQDIISKLPEMFAPGRAGNFMLDVEQDVIRLLLQKAIAGSV